MWHRLRTILSVAILCLVLGFGLGMVVRAWTGPGAVPPGGNPAGGVTGSGTATRVTFWSGTSTVSSNANLYWDNTNSRLGIGLTNPGTALTVGGSGDRVIVASNSAGKAMSLFAGGAESSLHYDNTSSLLIISNTKANIEGGVFAGGTTRLMVDSSGNVGLSMAPSYRLDVSGDVRFSGTLQGGSVPWARLTSFPAGCGAGFAVQVIGSTLTCIAVGGGGTPGGANTNVQYNNSGAFGGDAGFTYSAGGNDLSLGGSGSQDGNFVIKNTLGTTTVSLNADTNSWFNVGNLGVGTTTPYEKLNVRPDVNANLLVRPHSDFGAFTGVAIDSVNDANTVVMPMRIRGAPITIDGIVNTTNSVGINTTLIQRNLQVNNTMKFQNSSADVNDGVLGTAPFDSGLNIVGINTGAGYRQIRFWGSLIQNETPAANALGTTTINGQNVCLADGTNCPVMTTASCSDTTSSYGCTATCPVGYKVVSGGIDQAFTQAVTNFDFYNSGTNAWWCGVAGPTSGSMVCIAVCQRGSW